MKGNLVLLYTDHVPSDDQPFSVQAPQLLNPLPKYMKQAKSIFTTGTFFNSTGDLLEQYTGISIFPLLNGEAFSH